MDSFDQDTIRFILESAVMAPSADNHHRIRFQVDKDTILVRHTEGELPPQGGYKRVLALLSLGALVENLTIAASRFGISAKTTLLQDPAHPDLVLQILLQAQQAESDSLWQFIPLRHTNRHVFFRGPKMAEAEQNQLGEAANQFPACQLVWLDEPVRRRQALRLMRRAETERFHNRTLHKELFSAIRFDVGWHRSCQEGMPPGALGVEPLLRPFFVLLRHWPVMRLANFFGAHRVLGWRACDLPCRLAPNLGLLAVRNLDSQAIFDTGRIFQRVWLSITRQGRVLQPMPASALFALDKAYTEGIPANLQQSLAEGWKAALGGHIPLMLFRIGFAQPSPIVTGRKEIRDYLYQD